MPKLRDRIKQLREASILLTRLDSLITSVNMMIIRDRGQNPHKVDDATVETNPDGTTQATTQTMINALKAKYNTHIGSTTYHAAADATNAIAAADMSDLATGYTLANEMKTDFAAHVILMTAHITKDNSMTVDANAAPANATTLETLIALANWAKGVYNKHISRSHIPAVGAIATLDTTTP
jgi:hypothetical protein